MNLTEFSHCVRDSYNCLAGSTRELAAQCLAAGVPEYNVNMAMNRTELRALLDAINELTPVKGAAAEVTPIRPKRCRGCMRQKCTCEEKPKVEFEMPAFALTISPDAKTSSKEETTSLAEQAVETGDKQAQQNSKAVDNKQPEQNGKAVDNKQPKQNSKAAEGDKEADKQAGKGGKKKHRRGKKSKSSTAQQQPGSASSQSGNAPEQADNTNKSNSSRSNAQAAASSAMRVAASSAAMRAARQQTKQPDNSNKSSSTESNSQEAEQPDNATKPVFAQPACLSASVSPLLLAASPVSPARSAAAAQLKAAQQQLHAAELAAACAVAAAQLEAEKAALKEAAEKAAAETPKPANNEQEDTIQSFADGLSKVLVTDLSISPEAAQELAVIDSWGADAETWTQNLATVEVVSPAMPPVDTDVSPAMPPVDTGVFQKKQQDD